ncbi:uncharacterized protein LOC132202473 [Neocloeon triangulifer]|uniref:uncharacterized protein LOC132202473 n=1 Tax=Neocloeon triangulifer TaxID=2078957 RepID=UPI00286F181A|nr:uncharacterized protein LOC132202473 [Neocloeon triangulifer]
MSAGKRDKNYLQHYRKKWEKIPQLRGWLSEAPSTNPEYAKAFCKYCQKKLVPHVTGLLKHASCRNHLKAAKEYVEKINAAVRRAQEKALTASAAPEIEGQSKTDDTQPENNEEQQQVLGEILVTEKDQAIVIERTDSVPNVEAAAQPVTAAQQPTAEAEEEMETVTVIMDPISHTKRLKVVTNLGPLSTHVLDTIKGSPAIGLVVALYKLKDSRWTLITESVTDADGRCNDLLSADTMTAGRYKLQYALSQYYTIRNQDCFYPVVELTVDLADPNQKYCVPLLISPFSYSTYKA